MTSDNVAKRGRVQYIQYRPQQRSLGHATSQVLATRCCPLHIDNLFTIPKVGIEPAQGFAINTKRVSAEESWVITLTQFYTERLRPMVQPLRPFIYHFWQKRKGPFKYINHRFQPSYTCFNSCIATLSYTWSLKKVPLSDEASQYRSSIIMECPSPGLRPREMIISPDTDERRKF